MGLDDGLNSRIHGCRAEEHSLVGYITLDFKKKKCISSDMYNVFYPVAMLCYPEEKDNCLW